MNGGIKMEEYKVNEEPDSIELSTPAKGAGIKIYGNFSRPEEFKVKIKNAIELREWAASQINVILPKS